MLKTIKLAVAILTIGTMYNCKGKDGGTGPAGADGNSSVLKGTTIGSLQFRDEFGTPFGTDFSGVKLTLLGSSPEVTVQTDSKGYYAFENVPVGNYDLLIKKEGFPDHIRQSFIIFQGPKPLRYNSFLIQQKSNTVLSDLVAITNETEYMKELKFKVKVSPKMPEGMFRKVLFVYSNSPNVSINDLYFESNYKPITSLQTIQTSGDSAVVSFNSYNGGPYFDYYNDILESGKKVYCRAYAIATYDDYYTNADNKRVYPTLSSSISNVASAVVK